MTINHDIRPSLAIVERMKIIDFATHRRRPVTPEVWKQFSFYLRHLCEWKYWDLLKNCSAYILNTNSFKERLLFDKRFSATTTFSNSFYQFFLNWWSRPNQTDYFALSVRTTEEAEEGAQYLQPRQQTSVLRLIVPPHLFPRLGSTQFTWLRREKNEFLLFPRLLVLIALNSFY